MRTVLHCLRTCNQCRRPSNDHYQAMIRIDLGTVAITQHPSSLLDTPFRHGSRYAAATSSSPQLMACPFLHSSVAVVIFEPPTIETRPVIRIAPALPPSTRCLRRFAVCRRLSTAHTSPARKPQHDRHDAPRHGVQASCATNIHELLLFVVSVTFFSFVFAHFSPVSRTRAYRA